MGPLDTIDVFRDLGETARLLAVTASGPPLFDDAAAAGLNGKPDSQLTAILVS